MISGEFVKISSRVFHKPSEIISVRMQDHIYYMLEEELQRIEVTKVNQSFLKTA